MTEKEELIPENNEETYKEKILCHIDFKNCLDNVLPINRNKKDAVLVAKLNEKNMFACDLSNKFLSSNIVPLEPHEGQMPHFYISVIDNYHFMTKICFYSLSVPELYVNVEKVISHAECEIRMLYIMRQLLEKNYLKTIIRIIHVHTCQDISKLIENPDKCHLVKDTSFKNALCSYNYKVKNGLALPRCSFLVLELCDITLSTFLERYLHSALNFDILKSILFQIIYTLYAITSVYPQFHHYDLHSDNIMIKFTKSYDENDRVYYNFTTDKGEYYVPQYGIKVKIIDFEFATIPELNIVSVATKDRLLMFQRPSVDIILTLFWINRILVMKNNMNDDILNLLREIDPFETYKNFNMEYIRSIEDKYISYVDMMNLKTFEHYKHKNDNIRIKVIKNVNKFNGKGKK
jgi:hypothetical protein